MSVAFYIAVVVSILLLISIVTKFLRRGRFPFFTFILFLVAVTFIILAILDQNGVINFGITQAGEKAKNFYITNFIYFYLGFGILSIMAGTINFVSLGFLSKIIGIIQLLLGIYIILETVLSLNGVEPFVSWYLYKQPH